MLNRRQFIGTGMAAALVAGCDVPSTKGSAKVTTERLGVCSWSYKLPLDQVAEEMKKIGLTRINLALQPFLEGDERHGKAEDAGARARTEKRLASGEWKITSTMISFNHEDYTTLESIRKTGGFVPDATWEQNKRIVTEGAKLTKELGVKYMSLHAGFLDESDERAFAKYVERMEWVRDEAAKFGVEVILESGQETAVDLMKFMRKVPGVGINFDPANMILYGKGDPREAVKILIPWIRQVHVKDALLTKKAGTWGTEVPWGDGEVSARTFVAELEALGYKGDYVIERESGNARAADIRLAADRLK
jgi:sugar phosphate isomerase/epimerase